MRAVLMGVAMGLLGGAIASAHAQVNLNVPVKKRRQPQHARRETNATREARIRRNIQETYSHRYEIIGGGGYMRFRSGEYTKKNSEVSWNTALNDYLTPKLALVGEAQGSFGSAHALIDNQYGVARPQINEYFFMGGVNYRFYRKEKFALSAQGLGGIGWGIFSGGAKGLTGADLGVWQDGIRPAFALGIHADYNIQPGLAIRFTPTYTASMFRSGPDATGVTPPSPAVQNNIGFNFGVVYRFGHQ